MLHQFFVAYLYICNHYKSILFPCCPVIMFVSAACWLFNDWVCIALGSFCITPRPRVYERGLLFRAEVKFFQHEMVVFHTQNHAWNETEIISGESSTFRNIPELTLFSRSVIKAWYYTVHTTRVHGPCLRPVNTGVQKWRPCPTPVFTGRGHECHFWRPCPRTMDTGVIFGHSCSRTVNTSRKHG